MKRLATISLGIFYLALTCGVHLHVDTCCKTINTFVFSALADAQCEAPSEVPSDSGCCGDHSDCPTDEIDIQLDHDGLLSSTPDLKIPIESLASFSDNTLTATENEISKPIGFEVDPPALTESLYSLNSSFLFYG